MDKEVKFTIRMTVDGSQKIVTATADINKFAEEIEKARTLSTRLRDELVKSVQTGELLKNALSGLEQVRGYLLELTAASAQQSEAETKLANNMRNTMGARDEDTVAQQYCLSATQENAANIATMLGKVMAGSADAMSQKMRNMMNVFRKR